MLPPRTMITFKPAEIRFTFRVGGILTHHEHVLCQAAPDNEGYWFLPGGRAELGESASVSLLREMQEELGDSSHELGLYFLVTAPPSSYLNQSLETFTRVDEVGNHLRFDWLPIVQLESFTLYPPFFQKALQEIPEHTVHFEEHHSRFDSK